MNWYNWYKQYKLTKIKKRFLKRKMLMTRVKIWDLEFLLEQMKETREGFRREYDRLKEIVDAARRKLFDENYTFYYSATRDTVNIQNMPLTYEDLERLPEEPKEPWRFYKAKKPSPDKTICENMEKVIEKFNPDIEQMKKRMDLVDEGISKSWQVEGDGGILAAIEGNRTVLGILIKYIKKIK